MVVLGGEFASLHRGAGGRPRDTHEEPASMAISFSV